ncbi:MAG TPA: hypothetical protein VG889_00600 [Rhizomicrobium sp.]|nr:hypothetical protein [Rhizomicrobium sp.]
MIHALFAVLAAASPAAAMQPATYHCAFLMSETLTGDPSLMDGPLGDFTLDGKGRYAHRDGAGAVAVDKGLYRFTSGGMMGVVGRIETDAGGRAYLHVDKSIGDPPKGAPRAFDTICYRK